MKPTIEHAKKILELLDHGLVKGLGEPEPGKMCIEAAVNFALGLPHNDNPPCVGEQVIMHKISLNDSKWSSNIARANGMRKIAIAQLGSDTLNQEQFSFKLKIKSLQKIVPLLIQTHYDKLEIKDPKLLEYKARFEFGQNCWKEFYACYNYYCYNYYYYNYDYYYNYTCYYHHNYYYNYYNDYLLICVADMILEVLIDMKSPGCEWLHLIT